MNHKETETKKIIENHKLVANHFQEAATHHLEAAKHHKNGQHDKAAESMVKAHGHASLGNDAQKEDFKHPIKQHSSKES